MTFPLSHSNSSKPTSTSSSSSFHNNDMHNKQVPRGSAAAATTSSDAYNGETFKENDDDEDEGESKSMSEMSGLLTQACETPQSVDSSPAAIQKVSFASPVAAAANTSSTKTTTAVSIIQQKQNPTSHLKTYAHAEDYEEEDFPENANDDNDNDSSESDSLSSSSSSTDDDDDDSVVGIDQRRAFNVKRNQARLASLGLLQNHTSLISSRKGVKRAKKREDGINDNGVQEEDDDSMDDDDDPDARRGILLPVALLDFELSSSTTIDPSSMTATTTSVADIQSRFPHRERQIQKLAALMEVALTAAQTQNHHQQQQQQATTRTPFVPAPIFLTGGAGTGKTCITLELLHHYHQQRQQRQQQAHQNASSHADATDNSAAAVAAAAPPVPLISYLDCATLDATTVDEVIRHVVYDLQQQQQYAQSKHQHSSHHANGKKKRKVAQMFGPDNQNSLKRLKSPPSSTVESLNHIQLGLATGANNTMKESDKLDKDGNLEKKLEPFTQHHHQQQQQLLPGRRRSLARVAKQQQQDEYLQSKNNPTIQQMKKLKRKSKSSSSMTAQDIAASSENAMSHSTAPTAAWKLGRIWKRAIMTNRNNRGGGVGSSSSSSSPTPGFWVIDQAHCLFSMQMSGKLQQSHQHTAEKVNLLAQILLLPQTLGLNLTIIVISNHLFLDQTRLNMLAEPSKSLATLSGAVQPIRLHFPVYRGISVIQSVLKQPRHCHLITGNVGGTDDEVPATASLQQKVYLSFTNTLIQSVYDSTTDLKEILRLGRLLWPQYVEPLQPDRIDKTLESATSRCLSSSSKKHDSRDKKDGASPEPPCAEAIEGQVLAILNQKILPQMRPFLAASLYTLSASTTCAAGSTAVSSHELPDLAKYLLLAGYLCQVNRPDRDKHLFSIQKNGRRRKSQATENTAAENVAMGSTQQQQQQQQAVQRIPRLRSFPMERLLSVYVSVVALNKEASSSANNAAMSFIEQSERLQSLGNNTLGQHLAYLQSTGLLHEHPPRGPPEVIRLSEPRYCCSLTEDDARRIAQTLNFPLDRYLL